MSPGRRTHPKTNSEASSLPVWGRVYPRSRQFQIKTSQPRKCTFGVRRACPRNERSLCGYTHARVFARRETGSRPFPKNYLSKTASSTRMGRPSDFELARSLVNRKPPCLSRVFFFFSPSFSELMLSPVLNSCTLVRAAWKWEKQQHEAAWRAKRANAIVRTRILFVRSGSITNPPSSFGSFIKFRSIYRVVS